MHHNSLSSWGTPGLGDITHTWTGLRELFCSGVLTVMLSVSDLPCHLLPVCLFLDLSGVPNEYLDLKEVFNKARATLLPFTSSQVFPLLKVGSSPCLPPKPRLWRNISMIPWQQGSFVLPCPVLGLHFSSWARMTNIYALASTTRTQ